MKWIELAKGVYPEPHTEVLWYDAMFDKVSVFALRDPKTHDGDYTHWMPKPASPAKYANRKHPAPVHYYEKRNFIKENRMKWLGRLSKTSSQQYYKGAMMILSIIEKELKV